MDRHDHPTAADGGISLDIGPADPGADGAADGAAHGPRVAAPDATSDTPAARAPEARAPEARTYAGRAAAMRQSDRLRFAHAPSERGAPPTPFAPAPGPQSPQLHPSRAPRSDGWTPPRRASFLRLLAQDGCVALAARAVGLSHQSAYSLRARDPDFALAWAAALELARPNLADTLWSRAIDGVVEETERENADGSRTLVTRRRFDNRLAATLLARLDREAADAAPEAAACARALAGAWDELVDATEAGAPGTVIDPLFRPAARQADDVEVIDLDDLFAADDEAGRAGCWRVVEDAAGRAWTDLPPPPGWTGETAPRAALLGAGAADARAGAPPFRTLDAEEQALWDGRRASRAALEAARDVLRAREALDARDAWLGRTADLVDTLREAATLALAQAGEGTPLNRHQRRSRAARSRRRAASPAGTRSRGQGASKAEGLGG